MIVMTMERTPLFTYFVLFSCSILFIINLFLPIPVVNNVYSLYSIKPVEFFMEKNYLTLITYQFLHLNLQHLVSNMFVFFSVGRAIESEIGSLKLGVSYLLAGVLSGLLHVVVNPGSDIMVIGASGAIFGAIAILLLLMPFKVTSAMIIPLPGIVIGISMLLVEVSSILFSKDVWVAHDIHLYGFLVGSLTSFSIDYDRALRGLIISVIVLLGLYYWAFYVEGIVV